MPRWAAMTRATSRNDNPKCDGDCRSDRRYTIAIAMVKRSRLVTVETYGPTLGSRLPGPLGLTILMLLVLAAGCGVAVNRDATNSSLAAPMPLAPQSTATIPTTTTSTTTATPTTTTTVPCLLPSTPGTANTIPVNEV